MNCDSVVKLIPLHYYGELPAGDASALEAHIAGCAGCARELERQRKLASALEVRRIEPSAELLDECRADLAAAIRLADHRPREGKWAALFGSVAAAFGGLGRVRIPVGAMALLALGFIAGRLMPGIPGATPESNPEVYAAVRSVEPDASGGVKITYDETRRRQVAGRPEDANIQKLLVAASREDNAAVRVESVGLLKDRATSGEAREALLNAFENDPLEDVRLKALEGLRPLAADPRIMGAITGAMARDGSSVVRSQVADWMLQNRTDSMVGMFQDVVQREPNDYVRSKFAKALKDMNASVGTF